MHAATSLGELGCRRKKVEISAMFPHLDEASSKREVSCPYCHSTDTEILLLFGQQLLTVQYYCNSCHTPFEYIKDDDVLVDAGVAHRATCSQ